MDHPARGDADAYRRYFAGMDASLDQKAAFLSAHLVTDPGARILDLGCGSGALSARMAALAPGARVVGIDIDAGTIAQAAALHDLPNLEFRVGDAAAAQEPADAVVSCSLLHHVYTYAPRPYDETAAEAALRAHLASLRPGGLLVLRDFCRDGAPGETCVLELPGEENAALLRDFAARARPLDPLGAGFPLEELGEAGDGWLRFRLHRHWAAEFLLRKDYREDWEAELREEYAFWPLRRFAEVVEGAGARVVRAAEVRNPWVVQNRFAGRARRWDERGRPLPWPATNMVLVAQKVPVGGAVRLQQRRFDPAPPTYLRQSAWSGPDGTFDLVQRPTGAVDFLPFSVTDGCLRVLARNGWPRPALVAIGTETGEAAELRSGHVVEMISLASDGEDLAADFQARAGFPIPSGTRPEALLSFLPSAGLVDEVVRAFAVPLPVLPPVQPASRPPGQTLDPGVLQSFDAAGLLRAAEVGMLPEARLELAVRVLLRRLDLPAGRWAGEELPSDLPVVVASNPETVFHPAGTPFTPAAGAAGYLRRARSVFVETLAGAGGPVRGAEQVLELAVPAHHGAWTVSVLPVARDAGGRVLVGLERRVLPAAQLGFGDAALPCVPAWRLGVPPDAPEPLREAAARAAGCAPGSLAPLGAAYHPSSGITPERVQPFVVPLDAMPSALREVLQPVPLRWLLDRAALLRDGHLLIAAFRLACALDDPA
ncbi:class I SAM-dependent methyltransferase [Roseomonas populi]|uniref:Methyltransferase domain-containing protein n=1 Tax=Roseomonas populi TaxID=3121582 RepID=A0ABT1XAD2_9PROT|nr:class I SAM-dependent methyltransferase [Roseomonas pecuniae]MCR0985078.1 methyltransferase domain-containing protein [Roseomonas pecuniae]